MQAATPGPIPVGEVRPLTQAELDAQYAADVEAAQRRKRDARARLAAGESPFRVHRQKILAGYSTALRLQAVVLNLFNGTVWAKKEPVHLGNLLANADAEHVEILIDLLRAYAAHRENDADFLALGHELAVARRP